jgi:hypothetical protein
MRRVRCSNCTQVLYEGSNDEAIPDAVLGEGQHRCPSCGSSARKSEVTLGTAVEVDDAGPAVVIKAPPATASESMPIPGVLRKERERLMPHRIHLDWEPIREGARDSAWILRAFDHDGNMLDIAVQRTGEDAWLTIAESVVPDELNE